MGLMDTLRAATSQLTGYFVYLLLISTLGPLLFGYHLAELNAPQDVVTCKRKSISADLGSLSLPQCIPMTPLQFGLVQSIFTLGGLCGALIAGPLSARYGRVHMMRYNTFFCALGPIAEALSPGVGVMALGRFISGLGAGASLVVVPIYISEIAPPAQKGFFGSFTQIMTNMGIFITQLLGWFLSHDSMWRIILIVSGAIALCQLVGLAFAVDSPKWSAQQGQLRQAKLSLRRIRGENADIQDELERLQDGKSDDDEEASLLSHEDVTENTTTAPEPQKRALSIFEVLYHPRYWKAIIAVMAIMITQQFTGINSIIMYGVALLADLLAANSAILVLFVTLINLVVTTACAPLPDIIGRKPCLLISTAGMGIASVLLAIAIRAHLAVLSGICVLIFVASFGVGLGPIPFIMASELVEPEAVGATQSWALAANWIATFVVAQFFPVLNDSLGKGVVYFVFAGLAAFFFTFILWWVPETKGKKTASEAWGWDRQRDD